MSTHFNIDYSGWSEDASPISNDVNVKISHSKLVANSQTSERNKNIKIREKVSKSLKKHFGQANQRFFESITKENECWVYSKRWIVDDDGKQLLPKTYSAIIHNIKFPSGCLTQICGNKKCVNPNHLKDFSKQEQALETIKIRKISNRNNNSNTKLSSTDVSNIHKMYDSLLKNRNGKHKGIASEIHKVYNQVSLSMICQIIKNKPYLD